MPNYQNSRIYKIICNKTGLEHINATTLPLCQRLAQHKSELKRFLREIMQNRVELVRQPMVLYQHNTAGMWMINKPSKHRRYKHLLTKIAYMKEKVRYEAIIVRHLPSAEMLADMLTKSLQGEAFQRHIAIFNKATKTKKRYRTSLKAS
jgi:hypothetical protein